MGLINRSVLAALPAPEDLDVSTPPADQRSAVDFATLPEVDLSGWASDELQRLHQQRNEAYGGFWNKAYRVMNKVGAATLGRMGIGQFDPDQERRKADAAVDEHLRTFHKELGVPLQHVTGKPDDPLPAGVEPMPAGLSGRDAAEWRANQRAKSLTPWGITADGPVFQPNGAQANGPDGQPAKAVPRRTAFDVAGPAWDQKPVNQRTPYEGAMQWTDENGVVRDEKGRALATREIDPQQVPEPAAAALDALASTAGSEGFYEGKLTPEAASWLNRQRDEHDAEKLDDVARVSLGRQMEGLPVDAKQVISQVGLHLGEHLPFSPIQLLRMAQINSISKKDRTWQAWQEGGEEGPEPERVTRYENALVNQFLADKNQRQAAGETISGKASEIGVGLFPFMAEMLMTGGLATGAKKAVAEGVKAGVTRAAGEAAAERVGEWTAKSLTGRVARGAADRLVDASARTVATFPRGLGMFEARRAANGQVLDLGTEGSGARLAGEDGQSVAQAARNTFLSQMITFGSMGAGRDVNAAAGFVGRKAVGMLPEKAQADLRASWVGKLAQEAQATLARPRVVKADGLPPLPGLRAMTLEGVKPRVGALTQAGVYNYATGLADLQIMTALHEGFGVDLTPEQLNDPLLKRLGRAFVPTTDDAVATMAAMAIPGMVHGASKALDSSLKRFDAYKDAQRMRRDSAQGMANVRLAFNSAGVNWTDYQTTGRAFAKAVAQMVYWRDAAALHPEGSGARAEALAKIRAAAAEAVPHDARLSEMTRKINDEVKRTLSAFENGVDPAKALGRMEASDLPLSERQRVAFLMVGREMGGRYEQGRWMNRRWSEWGARPTADVAGVAAAGPAAGPAAGSSGVPAARPLLPAPRRAGPAASPASSGAPAAPAAGGVAAASPAVPAAAPVAAPMRSAQQILDAAADGSSVAAVAATGSTAPVQAQAQAQAQDQADEQDARTAQLEQNYRNMQRRLAVKAKQDSGDGSAVLGGDTSIMVTFAKQADMSPMRVYRDLRAMGIPRPNVIIAIRKQWPAFAPDSRLRGAYGSEEFTLLDAIKDLGGIAAWKKREGGRSATVHNDYPGIPLWLKNNKTGVPIDEILPQLAGMGFSFETPDQLEQAVVQIGSGRLEQARNPVKALRNHEETTANEYEDWEKNHSELIPLAQFKEGDTWWAFGEHFKALAVGDRALHIISLSGGSETWVTQEQLEHLRIDKGSLKGPEPAEPTAGEMSSGAATVPVVASAEKASSPVPPDAGGGAAPEVSAAAAAPAKGEVSIDPAAVEARMAWRKALTPREPYSGNATQAELDLARWRAIERGYVEIKAAQDAFPGVKLDDIRMIEMERGYGNDKVIVDTFFVLRADERALSEKLSKLYPAGSGIVMASKSVNSYMTPRGGEPTYKQWLAGEKWDASKVGYKPKPKKPNPQGELDLAASGSEPVTRSVLPPARKTKAEPAAAVAPSRLPAPRGKSAVGDTVVINGEKWSTGSALATGLIQYPNVDLSRVADGVLSDAASVLGSASMKVDDRSAQGRQIEKAQTAVDVEMRRRKDAQGADLSATGAAVELGFAPRVERAGAGGAATPDVAMSDADLHPGHTVPVRAVQSKAMQPTLSAASVKGDNPLWYHQGDVGQALFNAAQAKYATPNQVQRAAEIRAVQAAGYQLTNYRLHPYGTVWVAKKDGNILTAAGVKALVGETGKPESAPAPAPSLVGGWPLPETLDLRGGTGQSSPVPGKPGVTYLVQHRRKSDASDSKFRVILSGELHGQGFSTVDGVGMTPAEAYLSATRAYDEKMARRKPVAISTPKPAISTPETPSDVQSAAIPAAAKLNLGEADRARLAEIQAKLRAKLVVQVGKRPGSVREPGAEYGAAASAFDAESATLAAEMAGLYAKGGVSAYDTFTFAEFVAAVRRDMPDVWDGIKKYLHGAWTMAGADHPELAEVTRAKAMAEIAHVEKLSDQTARAQAAYVLARIDKPASVPEMGTTTSEQVPEKGMPAGVFAKAIVLRKNLHAKYGRHWHSEHTPVPADERAAWKAALKEVWQRIDAARKAGGDRWWDLPEVQAARAAQANIGTETILDNSAERVALRTALAKELYGNGAVVKGRELWVVMGLPGAGKSRVVGDKLKKEHGAYEVDADLVKEKLPEFNDGEHAGRVHKESGEIAEDLILERLAIPAGDNIMFPTVGRNAPKLLDKVDGWKKLGYRVHLIHVEVSTDQSIERALMRWVETGRFVDPQYIAGLGLQPAATFDKVKTEVDSYEHWNNDVPRGSEPVLVSRGSNPAVLRGRGVRPEDGQDGAGRRGLLPPARTGGQEAGAASNIEGNRVGVQPSLFGNERGGPETGSGVRSLLPLSRKGTVGKENSNELRPAIRTTDAQAQAAGNGGAGSTTGAGQGIGGRGIQPLRRGGEGSIRNDGVSGHGRLPDGDAAGQGGRPDLVAGSGAGTPTGGVVQPGGELRVDQRAGGVGAGSAGPGDQGRNAGTGSGGAADTLGSVDRNYRITAADEVTGTPLVKARANVDAIRILKRLQAEARPATHEEKRALARYIGWGHTALKNTMFPLEGRDFVLPTADELGGDLSTFKDMARELRGILTPEEYETARRSVQYAHYTSPVVVRAMWAAVQRMGFAGGRVLEPGFGVGRFVGLIPDALAVPGVVRFSGVEMDGTSAGIARALYPESDMRHQDYVDFPFVGEVFDLAIGNPPFSDRVVSADPRYVKAKMVLHDYFIRKSLDMVKPGGLVVLVTSHGTLDKKRDKTREMIAGSADLLGAIRMPQSAFYKEAGTKVVTDILFLRKRLPGQVAGGEAWRDLATVPTAEGDALVNEYYAAHPEMVLGVHSMAGRMRFGGGREYTVQPLPDTDGGGFESRLAQAINRLPEKINPKGEGNAGGGGVSGPAPRPSTGADDTAAALVLAPGALVNGGFNVMGDQLVLTDGGKSTTIRPLSDRPRGKQPEPAAGAEVPLYKSKGDIAIIKRYIPLRDALRRVLALQRDGTDGELAAAQQGLVRAYKLFVMLHGNITQRKITPVLDEKGNPVLDEDGHPEETLRVPIKDALKDDVFHGAVLALEMTDDDGKHTGKLSMLFTERSIGVPPTPKIETAAEALGVVMREKGRPDLAAAAAMLGIDEAAAERSLAGRIYRDPESGEWTVAEKYLSGNVKEKLAQARAKAAVDPRYKANVEALEKAQPADKPPSAIKLNLGMPLIPPVDIEQFMREVGGVAVDVSYNEHAGSWLAIDDKETSNIGRNWQRTAAMSRFGTAERSAAKILTAVLNGKPVAVTSQDSKGTVHVLAEPTAMANQKVTELTEAWSAWVFQDPSRMQRLARSFNDTFNVWRNEEWNGDHLTFPGLSKFFNPYAHQKGLAWRVIQQGNTYAVHEVGLGKTLGAALTVMELRRLGLARKAMIAVPNHMLGQWNADFHAAYPAAHLLLADEEQFSVGRRQRFLGRVAAGEFDAVVITHSALKLLGVAPETESKHIQEEIARFRAALEAGIGKTVKTKKGKGGERDDPRRRQIENAIEKLEDRLKRLSHMKRDKGLVWDDLGIDMLVVDEAHEYRKLRFATTRHGLKGIDPEGSERAWDLYMKSRTITDRTPGRGLLFLSGTPVVNTMGEVFTVQRFLQPQVLKKMRMELFDPWVTTFGSPESKFEKTPGKGYASVTRLAHWMNMTLLSGMWQQIGDYRRYDDLPYMLNRRPDVTGGGMQPLVVPESAVQKNYRERVIEERIKIIRARRGKPEKGDDIILSVITDAKHGAMDERFISPVLAANPAQKLEKMAQDVLRVYAMGAEDKRTQLVFMDLGLPGMVEQRGFSAYLRLRDALIAGGIPAGEIAFKQDYKKRRDMDRLQESMNNGQIRVLIGSMAGMGTGLNVQKRLYKAHFATIPWFPAMLEQAIGRIVRQGNMFKTVELAAYMTAGTIEEYMWGLNETKSRWIQGFYKGAVDEMGGELDSESDQYALLRAISSADPRVQRLAELQANLAKLQMLERAHLDAQSSVQRDLSMYEGDISADQAQLAFFDSLPKPPDTRGDKFSITVGDKQYTDRKEASGELMRAAMTFWMGIAAGSDGGTQTIGTFGDGFNVEVGGTNAQRFSTYIVKLAFVDPKTGQRAPLHVIQGTPENQLNATGVLQSMEYGLSSLDNEGPQKKLRESIEEKQASLVDIRQRVVPWTRGDEANKLRTQIRDLQAEIAADSKKDDDHHPPAVDDHADDGMADGSHVDEPQAEYGTSAPAGRSLLPVPRGSAAVRDVQGVFDIGQRGATQDAEYARRNPAKAWPDGFPNVSTETSLQALQAHSDHTAAKAGDVEAAGRVVLALAKPDKARALVASFPGATLVPVHAVEASGKNKLPRVYAEYLSHLTGMPVKDEMVQSNMVGRTGKGQWHRMAVRPTFDGAIESGRDYVLVDDVVTGGGSLSELRRAIEARGGRVVGATTLAAAQFSQKMALSERTRLALESVFGVDSLRDLLKSEGVYGGEHTALTESEARTLLSAGTADAVRSRIAAARFSDGGSTGSGLLPPPRSGTGAQEGVRETGALSPAEVVELFTGDVLASLGPQAGSPAAKAAIATLAKSVPAAMAASNKPYPVNLFTHAADKARAARDARIAAQRQKIETLLANTRWHAADVRDAMGTGGEGRLELLLSEVVWGLPQDPMYLDVPRGYKIKSPRDVAALTWALRTPTHERFVVVALGKGGRVLDARVVSVGLLDSASVHPREVFGWVPEGTVAVVLTHNHPSGFPDPSEADVRVTRQLAEAGKLLGYPVLDHVPTNGKWMSMRRAGLGGLGDNQVDGIRYDHNSMEVHEGDALGAGASDTQGYRLSEWEVIPSTMLPVVRDENAVRNVVEPVARAAEQGSWLYVTFLNTRNHVVCVERIRGDRPAQEVSDRIFKGAVSMPGVAAVTVSFNWQGPDVFEQAKTIMESSAVVGIRVLDVLDHAYISANRTGFMGANTTALKGVWNLPVPVEPAAAVADGAGPSWSVHEEPAEYGATPAPGADTPDWDAYAAVLAQRVADVERNRDRSVQITRAVERAHMNKLSKEMSALRRFKKDAQGEKAKAKVEAQQARTDAATVGAVEFRKVFGASPTRAETLGDLLLEAAAAGRRRGLAQKSKLDLRAAIREALNARTRTLMGHAAMPTNWQEVTAARNASMLASLAQIEENMKLVPEAQRAGAAAAEVKRLLGGGADVDAAVAGLAPEDYATLLTAAGAAIRRDVRAYYRRELTRLFGGAPSQKRLPDGRTIKVKTVGVVHAGLSRMTDEPRKAMQALIDGTQWDGLNGLTWEGMRDVVSRAKELLADDEMNKEFIADGHKTRRKDASTDAAIEIEAARDVLPESVTGDPARGTLGQRSRWWRSTPSTRALLLTGGDDKGAAYTVLARNLREANRAQLNLEASDNLELEAKMKGLGYTRDDLLALDYVPESVPLPDGRSVDMTRGEMMSLYGMTLDADAREKLVHNGWRPSRFRQQAKLTIRGEGENYEERLDASEAIIKAVIGRLTPRERAVVEWAVQQKSREWAKRANVTSIKVAGVSLFNDLPHFTLVGSVDRQAELPNVDDPASGFRRHMVDRMGMTKERQAHTHPLLVRPFLSVFRMQARDMSVYTAWAIPYRDAVSMLSRGPAKDAIVERWGKGVLGDMKDSLAYLTYQKGHTDEFSGLQKMVQGLERRVATFILGARLTTIAFNRYGGGLMMATRMAQDAGHGLAHKYLAKVFVPKLGMSRLWDPERQKIHEMLMTNGYFWDRWGRHAFRVFGQLSTQRMELDEAANVKSGGDALQSLKRRQRWLDFQRFMLSGMQKAEIANVVDAVEVLRAAGWPDARILDTLEQWNRETQNPSTPMEHSGQYTDVRRSGYGVVVPFLGQPAVMADQLLAQWIQAKRTKNWRRLAIFAGGMLASMVLTVLIRSLVRRANKGTLDGGDDKQEGREAYNMAVDALGQVGDMVDPVVGGRVVGWGLPYLWAKVTGDRSVLPYRATDESLLGQVNKEANAVSAILSKWWDSGDIDQAKAERLALSAHRVAGMLLGLPTGGVDQAVRAAAGAMDEPLGVADEKAGRGLFPPPRKAK
ncbi:MAG: JAB domain-containing protein [bacterium]